MLRRVVSLPQALAALGRSVHLLRRQGAAWPCRRQVTDEALKAHIARIHAENCTSLR